MNHYFRNGVVCVAAAVSGLSTSHGFAALPLEREAEIRALVEDAQVHRAAGRFEQALALLQRALDIKAAPWLMFNIGRVREVAAHHDLARRYFELAATAEDDAETRRKALEGVRRIDALGPRGIVRLRVSFAGEPQGGEEFEVRVDGHVWEPRLGRDFNLVRGPHVVEVSRSGYEAWRHNFELGELLVLEARLERLGEGRVIEPPTLSAAPVEPLTASPEVGLVKPALPSDGAEWLPWTLFGAGLLGAGVGVYFIADGARDWERVESAPSDSLFRDEAQALVESGRRKRDFGTVGAIAGGGVAVGGLLWALLGGADGQTTLTPMTSGGVTGLGVSGLF
jgi:hypothetical protein